MCSCPSAPLFFDNLGGAPGPVAQLVERLDGIQEVGGSTPPRSTELIGFTLAGFVAGEGCFSISKTGRSHLSGEPILKFVFSVRVEESDLSMLEALREFIGFGSIYRSRSRHPKWKPTVTYAVNSLKAHWQATIPFVERYLLPCAKRNQFDQWRSELADYVGRHNVRCGRGRSICAMDGCPRIVRGRGLCRVHYYRVTGY
jgi:hypothetical protein